MSRNKRRSGEEKSGGSKKHRELDLYDQRYDLNDYLEQHCNVGRLEDFWRFHLKYEAAQKVKRSSTVDKLINVNFATKTRLLYEKLPLYSRRGDRIDVSQAKFELLLDSVRTYHDFQNKTKFAKLKALRSAQRDLPIAKFRDEIVASVKENRVVLIAGDTGCGKSTQVPQFILEAGYNKIACTQPRRIACVSLANRVAHETLSAYKNEIGFQIRFERAKNKRTKVVFLTEGILLRHASDDVINDYDVIILDEVHERHLNVDFLIGIMKCLLHKRDFKLILMSATINLELFQSYFEAEGVKTIKVPGRLYPIDLVYKPIVKDAYDRKGPKFDCQPYLNLLEMIDAKYQPHEKGDVLIFLNGFNEISSLAGAVESYAEIKKNWFVLQLHSTLSLEEQDKVFYSPPDGVRKCIISTNIAETSVTIDGIRFVIDSGKVNRMTYENCGVNRLFETCISQDSAKQRAGRAGRTGPGICYRLYSEEEMNKFDPFTPAEIHLVPLENLILNMVTLGLSDIEAFPFLEKPSEISLRASLERLAYLEALKSDELGLSLTSLGDAMSRLPVDLTVGKMLIVSTVFGTVNSALALASLLSVQNPLSENKFYETQHNRSEYDSNHGEPITLLNLYKGWLEVKKDGGRGSKTENNSRTWSRTRGIEEQRFYEATKLIEQFRDILHDAELVAKHEGESLNGSERAVRNGELKQLRNLRRELKNDTKRKKMLTQNEDGKDLRDVEFRISNDFRKLQQLLDETRTDSFKDLMLLKIILTGALYPQISIEDEHNSSKTTNERLYHTKTKNYVFLRPTSYFNTNPDFLELHDSDIDVPPNGYFSKRALSRKHQILIYQKLLETKKTYLMNTFRMPALQTLLLFAKKIATNRTITKLIFDDFISIECPFLWQGKKLLLQSIDLRKNLKRKLETKLSQKISETCSDLIVEIVEFMQTNASYNVKRLLAADIKVIYDATESDVPEVNPFDCDFKIMRNDFGGLKVTENVIYDCLANDAYDCEAESILVANPCEMCGVSFFGYDFVRVLQHERDCDRRKRTEIPEVVAASETSKPNAKLFVCDKCGERLMASPVDFLRHKKICRIIKVERN